MNLTPFLCLSPSVVHVDGGCVGLVLLLLKLHHGLEVGQRLVPGELHGHGGHPEPGGDYTPQQYAAQDANILLDRDPQGGQRVDLGGHQQEPHSRSHQLGHRGTQQRQGQQREGHERGLCGDVHQAGQPGGKVERREV